MGILFARFGLVFLLFGVVAVVVGAHPYWIYAHVALTAGCWIYALATSRKELRDFLARDSSRRSARYGGNSLVQMIALAVILAALGYLSVRYPVNWDWTEGQVHSLTTASVEVLEQIDVEQGVEVIAFFLPGTESIARRLLEQYSYASDRVKVRVIDPNARPDLSTRFEVHANGVMIVCGGSCESAAGVARVTEPTEEELTRAIRSVISTRKRVYYLAGHGEANPDDEEVQGASLARRALEGENLEVATLILANQENVPDDAAAVIVAGADRSLFDRELEALDRYVRGGGSLLVLIDPIVETNLESLMERWGLLIGNDIIVDQQIQLFAGPQLGVEPVVVAYGSHPVTQRMNGQITTFHLARSVRSAAGDGDTVELALTGEASWAESDIELFVRESKVGLDASDLRGPISLAVARTFAAQNGRPGRLIVVGDSDFARNRYISTAANADLFLNAVNWLVGEEQFISIERKLPRASSVVMTNEQFYNFRYLSLFVFPEALLLLGIVIFWRRRTPSARAA